jgi:hypothetical protein
MSEAAFSITSALPAPRHVGADWWTAITRFFTASSVAVTEEAAPRNDKPRGNVPRRYDFLEHAAMSRAMYRL